jgi:hypothetical protein
MSYVPPTSIHTLWTNTAEVCQERSDRNLSVSPQKQQTQLFKTAGKKFTCHMLEQLYLQKVH